MYPYEYGTDPLFPKGVDFKIKLISEDCGCGVVSLRSFRKGEFVAKITGDIIPEIRQHTLQIRPDVHLYDKYFSGYFLHSCDPNITLDMENLVIYALRAIGANELLLMDYAETEDYLFKQFPCSCGAVNCRGWITGKKEVSDRFAAPIIA